MHGYKHEDYLHETYQCRMYSRELLMMDKEFAPKHVEFYDRINFG